MRSKNLLFLLTVLSISALTACSSNDRKFNIIGNIAGMPQQTVILEQVNANDIITIVDSERSKPDGHFELSGIAPEPGLYRLLFTANKYILLSIDKGNVKIAADWKQIENYTVDGSAPSAHLKNFIVDIRGHMSQFYSITMVMDTFQARGNDSMFNVAKKDYMDMRRQFTMFVEHYADTASYEPSAIFAARMLNANTELTYLAAFSQSLNRRFPNTKMTKDFEDHYSTISLKQKHSIPQAAVADSGSTAPEVSLPTSTGTMVTLSSLRGKYVLLDFWASWCGPCRGENPNVVAAYAKFKDKNFTILGVSLDNNKDAWQKAIKDDNLTWTQVSDLKGWTSAAATAYNVQSIPCNFLIDPKGHVIDRNLRGEQLEARLSQILSTAKTPNP